MELNQKNKKSLMIMVTMLIVVYVGVQNMESVAGALRFVWDKCLPVTLGFAIAFVLNVLMSFLEEKPFAPMKRSKKKWVRGLVRPLTLILTLVLAIGAIMAVIFIIIPRLRETVELLAATLPEYIDSLIAWGTEMMQRFKVPEDYVKNLTVDMEQIGESILGYLKAESGVLAGAAMDAAMSVVDVASNMLLGLCIAIYVLLGKEKIEGLIRRGCDAFLPEKVNRQVRDVAKLSFETFSNFVRGQVTEAVILGVLCYLGMLLFRFPHAAVISLLIGVSALIPIAGAWIGGGVGAFLILMVDPVKAIWFIVYLLVLQQLEGNLIYPRVVGTSLGLPGLLVLSAVIVSGNIGGVIGMLIGVPLAAVAYELLKRAITAGLKRRRTQEE